MKTSNKIKLATFIFLMSQICSFNSIQAQLDNTQFVIENTTVQEITTASPYSQVELYSTPSGGLCVAALAANHEGRVIYKYNTSKAVAPMALDVDKQNVATISEIEFELKDLRVEKTNTMSILKWNFKKSENEVVNFEILKSTNNKPFENIGNILASAYTSYIFNDENPTPNSVYQIQIKTAKRGLRYQSDKIPVINNQSISVCPTFAVNSITIIIPLDYKNSKYQIVNVLGQSIGSGTMHSISESIDVSNFSSGHYYITFPTQN